MENKILDMLQRIAGGKSFEDCLEPEVDFMVSQNAIPSKKYFGGAVPFAFTEQGISMLSVVLKKFSISCLMLIICGGLG